MARKSRYSAADRKKMLELVNDGVTEQDIRRKFGDMSSPVFAQQLKMAMVESGQIKQATRGRKAEIRPTIYEVTKTGRLTITDLTEKTGFEKGAKFTLEKPRGKSICKAPMISAIES